MSASCKSQKKEILPFNYQRRRRKGKLMQQPSQEVIFSSDSRLSLRHIQQTDLELFTPQVQSHVTSTPPFNQGQDNCRYFMYSHVFTRVVNKGS